MAGFQWKSTSDLGGKPIHNWGVRAYPIPTIFFILKPLGRKINLLKLNTAFLTQDAQKEIFFYVVPTGNLDTHLAKILVYIQSLGK